MTENIMNEVQESIATCDYCAFAGQTPPNNFSTEIQAFQVYTIPNPEYAREGHIENLRSRGWSEANIEGHRNLIRNRLVDRLVCNNHLQCCDWCHEDYAIPVQAMDDPEDTNTIYTPWNPSRVSYDLSHLLCRNCAENAHACNECDGLVHDDDIRWVNGDIWCESCCDDNANWCEMCEEYYRYPCDEHEGSGRFIHDYGYKPDPKFWMLDGKIAEYRRDRLGTIFMGFELEVESRGNSVADGSELVYDYSDDEGYFYMKTDSSLSQGFEVVSHPMTLERYHQLDFDWMSKLSEQGYSSWSVGTCGIHVHISRDAFKSPAHTYKFAQFIAMHKPEMTRLAGRESDRWATFDGLSRKVMPYLKGELHPTRYEAVNFCNNNTLELRFFKGSLRKERLLSALELTHAVATYTGIIDSNDAIHGALEWSAFASWVVELNAEQYPNLVHYIAKFSL